MNLKKLFLIWAIALSTAICSAQDDTMFRIYAGGAIGVMDGQYRYVDKGFQVGMSYYIPLGSSNSLFYFQPGFEYNQVQDEAYDGETIKEKVSSFSLPLNICLITKQKRVCRFEAFVGGNLRFNADVSVTRGGTKTTLTSSYVNPFQMGMNVGVALHISKFVISCRYNPDFTDFYDHNTFHSGGKTSYHFLTLGYSL